MVKDRKVQILSHGEVTVILITDGPVSKLKKTTM